MQILPVLDLMNGQVVRGVAGQRETYRPVKSVLSPGCEPLKIAQAWKRQLDFQQFYVADLDGIRFGRPQRALIETLVDSFPGLWLDCGIRGPGDVPASLVQRNLVFVAGLETIAGPRALKELCDRLGPERIVFSLDLKTGQPLGDLSEWRVPLPFEIAQEALESGVRKMIVLDLANVGVGAGVSTLPLCRQIKNESPEGQVITGGGVRNVEDLIALKDSQIDGVLVASAFHNGNIRCEELKRLE